eukprot:gene4912-6123_t
MRLSKPNIPTINPIICEREDIASDALLPSLIQIGNNDTYGGGIEALGMTSMLQLQSGVIYLGEIFSSYISLNNHSQFDVSNVFIKVELQTTTQRITLLDSEQQPVPKFGPGFSSDFVVQREVKESDVNILVCEVNYTTPEGEHKKFRKFFKFKVMNPLVLKTRIHSLPNIIFLEACLENATQGSLFIESIKFEPLDLFESHDISFESSIFSSDVVFLKKGNSRNYLFKIIPKNPNDLDTKNSTGLGKLDITWRSYLGEIGRLKTALIQRKVNLEEIECILTNIPKVELEKPFLVTAKILNKTNRILFPVFVLVRNKMDGIMINGHLPKIGSLQPNTSINIDIEMFPLKPGMQQIVGLAVKLLDSPNSEFQQPGITTNQQQQQPPQQQQQQKNFYELGVLADIFVENNNITNDNNLFEEIKDQTITAV